MKKEQRPTHNPPATPSTIRAAREADANKHADTRQSAKEIRETRSKFLTDYNAVRDFHGTGMANGLRSYAAKYTGQKEGLKQLKLKWDGKFQGEDLKGYIKMVQDLERDIEKLSPSGGTIKINDKNDRANEGRSGGTITDVPVTADAEAARQEQTVNFSAGTLPIRRSRCSHEQSSGDVVTMLDQSFLPQEKQNDPRLVKLWKPVVAFLSDPVTRFRAGVHEAAHAIYMERAGGTAELVGPQALYDSAEDKLSISPVGVMPHFADGVRDVFVPYWVFENRQVPCSRWNRGAMALWPGTIHPWLFSEGCRFRISPVQIELVDARAN